jgi:hypothetical protein
MKKLPGSILFIYSALFSFFIIGINAFKGAHNLIFTALLAPLAIYFIFSLFQILKNPKHKNNYIPINKVGLMASFLVLIILCLISVSGFKDTNANDVTDKRQGVIFEKQAYEKKEIKIILDENEDNVDIKKLPLDTSDSVGKANLEQTYYYVLKQNNWYKIVLENNQFGWINAKNVLELE